MPVLVPARLVDTVLLEDCPVFLNRRLDVFDDEVSDYVWLRRSSGRSSCWQIWLALVDNVDNPCRI